jgi:hypothetical protein
MATRKTLEDFCPNYVQEFDPISLGSIAKSISTGLEEENNRKDSCSIKICKSRVADPDPERIRIPLGLCREGFLFLPCNN